MYLYEVELNFYILAGVLISIVGFYDDLNELPSFVKLLLQIFIFFIISFGDNSLINSFHGVLGIYELSYFESLIFSLFVYFHMRYLFQKKASLALNELTKFF